MLTNASVIITKLIINISALAEKMSQGSTAVPTISTAVSVVPAAVPTIPVAVSVIPATVFDAHTNLPLPPAGHNDPKVTVVRNSPCRDELLTQRSHYADAAEQARRQGKSKTVIDLLDNMVVVLDYWVEKVEKLENGFRDPISGPVLTGFEAASADLKADNKRLLSIITRNDAQLAALRNLRDQELLIERDLRDKLTKVEGEVNELREKLVQELLNKEESVRFLVDDQTKLLTEQLASANQMTEALRLELIKNTDISHNIRDDNEKLRKEIANLKTTEAYWLKNDLYGMYIAKRIKLMLDVNGHPSKNYKLGFDALYDDFSTWHKEEVPGCSIPSYLAVLTELTSRWGPMSNNGWFGLALWNWPGIKIDDKENGGSAVFAAPAVANETTRSSISEYLSLAKVQADIETLRSELARTNGNNERLNGELEKYRKDNAEIRVQNGKLSDNLDTLHVQLAQARTQSRTQNNNRETQRALLEKRAKLNAALECNRQMQNDESEYDSEFCELQAQLSNALANNKLLQDQVSHLTSELEETKQKIGDLQDQNPDPDDPLWVQLAEAQTDAQVARDELSDAAEENRQKQRALRAILDMALNENKELQAQLEESKKKSEPQHQISAPATPPWIQLPESEAEAQEEQKYLRSHISQLGMELTTCKCLLEDVAAMLETANTNNAELKLENDQLLGDIETIRTELSNIFRQQTIVALQSTTSLKATANSLTRLRQIHTLATGTQ